MLYSVVSFTTPKSNVSNHYSACWIYYWQVQAYSGGQWVSMLDCDSKKEATDYSAIICGTNNMPTKVVQMRRGCEP